VSEPTLPGSAADEATAAKAPPSETTKHLAYAEAALMLMEGLLQLLVSRQVLTADEIVRTVETVIATKQQMTIDGEHPEISLIAAGVLSTLANSVAAMEVARSGAT
jgi:hypothetical protein